MSNARFLDPSSIPLKRQSGGSFWASVLPILWWGLIITGLLAVALLLILPVVQVIHAQNIRKAEIARLQVQIAAATEQQTQLKLELEQMKNNPSYVEHIARDQLNMGKPGETIIRFDKYQQTKTSAGNAAAAP